MARKLPHDVRVQQILQSARSCFLQDGYYQTRVEDIARRAGMSKGGVYFHFRSKREIFHSLVVEDYERSMGALREIVASQDVLPVKLRALARFFLQLFATNADHARFMVVMGDMALRDQEMREQLQQLHRSYIQEMSNLLRQGVEQGDVREIDVEATAELLKALTDGIQMSFALGMPLRIDRLLRTGLEIILHGVERSDAGATRPSSGIAAGPLAAMGMMFRAPRTPPKAAQSKAAAPPSADALPDAASPPEPPLSTGKPGAPATRNPAKS